ncbi:MAG: alpha/beta hydrolase [Proteobacteria bacterium]|nr:alpha/beta hydrolase [Pseudomonadota bacterium]
MKAVWSILSYAVVIYVGLCLFLYLTQRSVIYYPVKGPEFPGVDAIQLNNNGEVLNAWVVNPGKQNAILYFGGNAEPVVYNAPMFRELFNNYTVYLTDYRGYGNSTGSPTESGLYADALAWYDKLASQHRQISVIGRSLGAGVAIYLVDQREVKRLALVTPFDSATNMARHYYPYFPASFLLKDKYDSLSRAKRIKIPILVIAGERDEIVPRARTQSLVDMLPKNQTRTVIIKGVGHNDLSSNPAYAAELSQFINMGQVMER